MSTTADRPDDHTGSTAHRYAPGPDRTVPEVSAADTGNAHAVDGGTAVTGHREPAAGLGAAAMVSVQVRGTGDAIANGPHAVAVSGNLTVVERRARQEPASWPHQVGVIPARANCFQDRAEVARLRQALAEGGTAVVGQVLAGMGGVGKTQLAADYARHAQETGTVDVLVWITAASSTAAASGYGQAGIEVLGADPADPHAAARQFLAWLEPKAGAKPCRWLVVLDDVADPADLAGWWPPPTPYGRTLVTTRRRDAALTGNGRRLVEVGLFSRAEAVAYLTGVLASHGRVEPADQLAALADDLGCLPLALSQAAAYLADAHLACADYRDLLADRATTLADAAPDALPDDQGITVAAAWSLSIDRADALRPAGLARPMLHLASFLDANGIPETVLTSEPARAYLTAHRNPAADGHTPPDSSPVPDRDAARALRALHQLHLIDHTPGTPHQSVRIHHLVQRAARDTLTPHQHERTARTAATALLAAWPSIERDTALAQALRANTAALSTCADDVLHRPHAHAVLYRAGRSLGETGQVTAARSHFQHLTDTARHHLGPDHPDTFAARHELAEWRGEAGDAAGAAAAFADLLDDRVRVQGADHPDILITRHELARWRGEAGDAAGAAAAFADLLDDRVRVQGADHPSTFITRYNLAQSRGRAGDAAGAAAALADLLDDRVRVLGADHPRTLTTRRELAYWRREAGDAAGAAAALADLLDDHVRVLGADHPYTLAARHELAYWRGEAGDTAGAAAALTDLLDDHVRVLGADHPYTLAARHQLAYWRGEAGDAAGAAAALTDLLDDHVRVLGADHPHTLTTRRNLAYWRNRVSHELGREDHAPSDISSGEH
ncbi:tetratricopeptide repeat protein [Streptomyces sp. NPDC096040]|uniref:tetratricopeptide repeat protein n=1 Tax=Streptomyces sp. NPDC096040 TaxID=3155541 RepID=UPI0033228E1C